MTNSLDLLVARAQQAAAAAKSQDRLATFSSVAHYVFGIIGIAGGAVAAGTASADGIPSVIPVTAGVLAAIGSGVPTVFHLEKRAKWHAESAVRLRAVPDFAENEFARVSPLGMTSDEVPKAVKAVQQRLDAALASTVYESDATPAGR